MSNENEVITREILRSELKKELDIAFEKFAIIVNGAFAHQQKYMDKKFGEIDARFDRIETRMDKVEYKVDVLQDQMELVNKRQVKTEKRIEKLEVAAAI